MIVQTKSWYLSRTILVNILMGVAMIVGVFQPAAGEFIKAHFAEAGSAWAIVNVILRLITKKEIA
jgi:hypothetical protein